MRSKDQCIGKSVVSGFLYGFVENKIDKPPNGLYGDCTVHYGGDHSMYKMKVKLNNGKRDGDAVILKGDAPFLKLEYRNGTLTGDIVRVNDYRMIDLRGRLVDGVESGIFQEYDGDTVVWRGYYRNGRRYSEVMMSAEMEGYYDERSVADGELFCVAQYIDPLSNKSQRIENGGRQRRPIVPQIQSNVRQDVNLSEETSLLQDQDSTSGYASTVNMDLPWMNIDYDACKMKRNGTCFEFENGKVARVCLYEEGRFQRVLIGFHGTTMTQYNSKNQKEYEGEYKGDMKSGYIREGRGKEYVRKFTQGYGLIPDYLETTTLVGNWENGKKSGVFFERDEMDYMKRKCIFENDQIRQVPIFFTICIMYEFDKDNKRLYDGEFKGNEETGFVWEGKGREYGDDGFTPLFFGNFKDGKRDGYGEELYGAKSRYVGEWKKGKKHGWGKEIDPNGYVINYGVWVEGEYQKESFLVPLQSLNPPQLQELIVGDNSFNESNMIILKLNDFVKLKRIMVGNDSFGCVRFLEVNGLPELDKIVIGERSFTAAKEWKVIRKIEKEDGGCRIVNCPKLHSIDIGNFSFADYYGFQVESSSSLKSLRVGVVCFFHATSFSLTSLIGLVS